MGGDLPSLKKGEPIFKDHYSASFNRFNRRIFGLLYSPPSCLRIFDPLYDSDVPFAPSGIDSPVMGTLSLTGGLEGRR